MMAVVVQPPDHATPSTGLTTHYSGICNVWECPVLPCTADHPKWTYDWIASGTHYVDGESGSFVIPGKCACTSCDGATAVCDDAFWKPLSASGACPEVVVASQASEKYSTTVFSRICRYERSWTCIYQGQTGYLKGATCEGTKWPNQEPPSVFCPQSS
jgi:hypothetical protein